MVLLNLPNNLYPFQFKVLAVDDDYNHLLAIENTLTSFGYQVLKSQNPDHALAMIGKTKVDIIVCGIPSSNIGAFNLIRTAQSRFNIPVILMASDIRCEVTFSGRIISGAAQCVAKLPLSDFQVLKNLWQHVVRTPRNEYFSSVYSTQIESTSNKVPPFNVVRETPTIYGRGPSFSSNPTTPLDKSHSVPTTAYGGGLNNCFNPNLSFKIREEKSESLDHDHDDHKVVSKKRRFNWTEEYHQMFLDGIEDITLKDKKIVPATLLKYMHDKGVPQVNRQNIASHLQKYRANCKKHKHEGHDFANSDVVTNKQHCPPVAKTQNVEQETPPVTNEIDDWWNTLEEIPGLETKSTSSIWPNIDDEFIEKNIIPTWPIEISDTNMNFFLDPNP